MLHPPACGGADSKKKINMPKTVKKYKFKPLTIRRTSAYIVDEICKNIRDESLAPGDRLRTEKDMASQFGVSVVTLREALRSLEDLGVIKKKKGRGGGIIVSEANNESIKTSIMNFFGFKKISGEHLYSVRMIIEPVAVKIAVRNITQTEIEKLEINVSLCEEKLRKMNGIMNEDEFFEIDQLNNDFHSIIAESTHNPILSLTIDYIMDFIPECETKYLKIDIPYCERNIKEHRDILENIKIKNEAKCENLMLQHLEWLITYLKDSSKPLRN